MTVDMKQQILETHLRRHWSHFANYFPQVKSFFLPKIMFNKRLKTTAGRAFFDDNSIDISMELFDEYQHYILDNTLPHEIGHIIAAKIYDDYGHGKGWKYVMQKAGFEYNRLHNLINTLHEARRAKII